MKPFARGREATITKRSVGREISWLLAAMIPIVAVMAVLVFDGQLAAGPAVIAAAAAMALTALVVRPLAGDLSVLACHFKELARGGQRPPPHTNSMAAVEVLAAFGQIHRGLRGKLDEANRNLGFHESLFDALPNPLLLLNRQRRIVRANGAARALLGANLKGRDLTAVLRAPVVVDTVEQVLGGAAGQTFEFEVPLPTRRSIQARCEPLPDQGLDGVAVALSLDDVTALRKMEEMRVDFVANASHELRTPISALLGFIETLQGPAKDDDAARERFLSIMHDQASRMVRLVGDLLVLSRIELAEHTPPEGYTDIGATIRDVASGLELAAAARRMTIILDLPADLPAVGGRDDQIAQIFQNLIDNAIKYGAEGTEVTVRARCQPPPADLIDRASRAVTLTVEDRGEGIATEHLPRLTERFFRVDTARSRRQGGTGLGLAIVKHLVNHNRGLLRIESEVGKGSAFTVIFPALEKVERRPPATSGPSAVNG